MRFRFFALISLAIVFPVAGMQTSPAQESLSTWTVDATHSAAMFGVQHLGAGRFWGRFDSVTGKVQLSGSDSTPSFDVTIAVDSVHTGNANLDAHLLSPDFFNQKEFETMSFKSASSRPLTDRTWTVEGSLTLLGVSHPITAEVELVGRKDMGRGERVGLEATFVMTRSQWGMSYGIETGALGDEVKVIVGIEATE